MHRHSMTSFYAVLRGYSGCGTMHTRPEFLEHDETGSRRVLFFFCYLSSFVQAVGPKVPIPLGLRSL